MFKLFEKYLSTVMAGKINDCTLLLGTVLGNLIHKDERVI